MKMQFILLIATIFVANKIQSQNVGIGTNMPLATLSVGSSSQFRVNSTGNILRINNIPYSFPTSQGADQYLKNDGTGNLTWAPASKPVVRVFTMQGDGSNWLIDNPGDFQSGSNADPTLVLHRGFTYQFINNSGGHPFVISDFEMSGAYNVGVTNNGFPSGIITFTVPMDAPATLYYYCNIHPIMNGTLMIN
jgi:hypothetical protein